MESLNKATIPDEVSILYRGLINAAMKMSDIKYSMTEAIKNTLKKLEKLQQYLIEPAKPEEKDTILLSDFNQKLKQGLEWNPKEDKK